MLGAIAGDIIGSEHEGSASRGREFTLFTERSCFTDDTVCTIAVAHAVRTGRAYDEALRKLARNYPDAGYGTGFRDWFLDDHAGPYNSFGNGSAMRVSPIAWAFNTLEEVIKQAACSAAVTHSHREGIRGAAATAAAVFAARTGSSKDQIVALVTGRFSYDLSADLPTLEARGGFDATCQGTVPLAIGAFLHSRDFEDAVRIAVSFGGDTDTLACIAGSIAEPFYGAVPAAIEVEVLRRLDDPLRQEVLGFAQQYGLRLARPVAQISDDDRHRDAGTAKAAASSSNEDRIPPGHMNYGIQQRRMNHAAAMVVVEAEGLGSWLADKSSSIAGTGRLWVLPDGRSFFPECIEWKLAGTGPHVGETTYKCVQSGWQLIPPGEGARAVTHEIVGLLWHSGAAARGWSSGRSLSDEDRRRLRKALGDELMSKLEASHCKYGTIWDRWS